MLTFVRLDRVPLRFITAFGAFALALMLTVLTVPAQAHSVLLETSPDDGEQLEAAPEEVSLTFNEDITALGTEVVITDEAGETVSEGEVEINGPVVSQALAGERPEGAYLVTWRAVSADGHPISGEFTFTAAQAVGGAEGAGEAPEEDSETAPEADSPTLENEPEADSEAAAEGTQDETDEQGSDQDEAEDSSGGLSAGTWVVIGVLIVAAIILITVLSRSMSASKREE